MCSIIAAGDLSGRRSLSTPHDHEVFFYILIMWRLSYIDV